MYKTDALTVELRALRWCVAECIERAGFFQDDEAPERIRGLEASDDDFEPARDAVGRVRGRFAFGMVPKEIVAVGFDDGGPARRFGIPVEAFQL